MAHYAFLTEENIVIEVITGNNEDIKPEGAKSWEEYYSRLRGLRCLRTSYNTLRGQHLNGGIPFRGNFAAQGSSYDEALDAFIPPKPSQGEWGLDVDTYSWVAIEETE
jgi:hypothetical protein